MRKLKRWLIVILIVAMPLFLSACDGGGGDSGGTGKGGGGNKGTVTIGGGTT